MGGGGHPFLGDVFDGLAGGHVAFFDLNHVFGLLHENHVVTGTPVDGVDLKRLLELGLGLVVAGHFIEQLAILHESGRLNFLFNDVFDIPDRFLAWHPATKFLKLRVDRLQLPACL